MALAHCDKSNGTCFKNKKKKKLLVFFPLLVNRSIAFIEIMFWHSIFFLSWVRQKCLLKVGRIAKNWNRGVGGDWTNLGSCPCKLSLTMLTEYVNMNMLPYACKIDAFQLICQPLAPYLFKGFCICQKKAFLGEI